MVINEFFILDDCHHPGQRFCWFIDFLCVWIFILELEVINDFIGICMKPCLLLGFHNL